MTSAFLWQNSISLCPASFCTPRPNLPVTPGVSWLPTFAFQSPIMKRTSFWGVLESLIGLHRTVQLLQYYWSGHRLGLPWYWITVNIDCKLAQPFWKASAGAAAKSLQSCLTLCDPIDGSPPGSSVPRILQARPGVGCHFLLQCMKVKVKSLSCVWLFATPWTAAYQALLSMGFSSQEYWSEVHCLLLGRHLGCMKI